MARQHGGGLRGRLFSRASKVQQPGPADFVLDKRHARPKLRKPVTGLLVIYAPWCGHCQALGPELEAAAAVLPPSRCIMAMNGEDPATQPLVAGLQEGVQGYPTIKVVKQGFVTVNEYARPREAAAIVEFLHSPVLEA